MHGHSAVCEVTGVNCGVTLLGVEVPCAYRYNGHRLYIKRLNDLIHDAKSNRLYLINNTA